jgi:ubiquinone/menaquinone biosynthesis C-methylase UbiE
VSVEAARTRRIAALGFDVSAVELEPVASCNLCGSSCHVEVARRDRYGFPVRYVVCSACGLGFLSPRPTTAAYAQFYDSVYRPLVSAYHGRRIDAETVQEEQKGYATELVAFLRSTLPAPPGTLLDVGGSTGVVAGAVRDAFGSAATVLDPSPDELAVAAAAGMEAVAGFAESANLGGRRFDLVLLCQTIDHLLDVAATLAAIRSWLSPVGHAFVDVLDVSFATRRRGSVEEAVKIDHPYYLTRETAIGYFDRVGLQVTAERLSDDGHWGFVLAPGEPREPDWEALRSAAGASLRELWRQRAAS